AWSGSADQAPATFTPAGSPSRTVHPSTGSLPRLVRTSSALKPPAHRPATEYSVRSVRGGAVVFGGLDARGLDAGGRVTAAGAGWRVGCRNSTTPSRTATATTRAPATVPRISSRLPHTTQPSPDPGVA